MTHPQSRYIEVWEETTIGEEAADELEAGEARHLFAHLFEYSNCRGPVGGVCSTEVLCLELGHLEQTLRLARTLVFHVKKLCTNTASLRPQGRGRDLWGALNKSSVDDLEVSKV